MFSGAEERVVLRSHRNIHSNMSSPTDLGSVDHLEILLSRESIDEIIEVSSDESSSGTSQNGVTVSSASTEKEIGHSETIAVSRSKYLVYVALLFAALGISTATYFFTRKSETNEFESEVR